MACVPNIQVVSCVQLILFEEMKINLIKDQGSLACSMLLVSGDSCQKIPAGNKQDQQHAGYSREKERVGHLIFLNQTPLIAHHQPIFQSSSLTQSMEQAKGS